MVGKRALEYLKIKLNIEEIITNRINAIEDLLGK